VNGGVGLVIDRTRRQPILDSSEQPLDHQQFAIAQHRLRRIERGVGAQNIEPVILAATRENVPRNQ
jgi:hypothetical protein